MVLALVARIKFFLLVKRLALHAGQRQGGGITGMRNYTGVKVMAIIEKFKGNSPITDF